MCTVTRASFLMMRRLCDGPYPSAAFGRPRRVSAPHPPYDDVVTAHEGDTCGARACCLAIMRVFNQGMRSWVTRSMAQHAFISLPSHAADCGVARSAAGRRGVGPNYPCTAKALQRRPSHAVACEGRTSYDTTRVPRIVWGDFYFACYYGRQ